MISRAGGDSPAERQFEDDLATLLVKTPDVDVVFMPAVYDLPADHPALAFLKSVSGDLVVFAWLFPRATRWVLHSGGVAGRAGESLLDGDHRDLEGQNEQEGQPVAEDHGSGSMGSTERTVDCFRLTLDAKADTYVEKIRQIARESIGRRPAAKEQADGNPKPRESEPPLSLEQQMDARTSAASHGTQPDGDGMRESLAERWYPVVDYVRCTNCLECIDFCLFGVYDVDAHDQIVVNRPDNCKQGCPACSRVCPEGAILFPTHRSPAIAGGDGGVAKLKIDLSDLLGGASAGELAAHERDRALNGIGHETPETEAKRGEQLPDAATPLSDDLDDLIDRLDALDL